MANQNDTSDFWESFYRFKNGRTGFNEVNCMSGEGVPLIYLGCARTSKCITDHLLLCLVLVNIKAAIRFSHYHTFSVRINH